MKYVNPYMRKTAGVKDYWNSLTPEEQETIKRTGIGAGAGGLGGLLLGAMTGRKKKGLDALAHYAGWGLGGAGVGGLAGYGYDKYRKYKDNQAAEIAKLEAEKKKLQDELDNSKKKPEVTGPKNARERFQQKQKDIRARIKEIDAQINKLNEQHAQYNSNSSYDAEGNFLGDYTSGEAHFRKNKGVRRKTNKYGDVSYEALIAGDTVDKDGNSKLYADLTRDPEAAALDEVRKQQAAYDKEHKDRFYGGGASDIYATESDLIEGMNNRMGLKGRELSKTFDPNTNLMTIKYVDANGKEREITTKAAFRNVDRATLEARIARIRELQRLNNNALSFFSTDEEDRSVYNQAKSEIEDLAAKLYNADFLNNLRRVGLTRQQVEAMQKAYSDVTTNRDTMLKLKGLYDDRLKRADAQLKAFDNSALARVGLTVDKNNAAVKDLARRYREAKLDAEKQLRTYGDVYATKTQQDRSANATKEQRRIQNEIKRLADEREQLQGQLPGKWRNLFSKIPYFDEIAETDETPNDSNGLLDEANDYASDLLVPLFKGKR